MYKNVTLTFADGRIDYESCGRAGNTIVQKSLRGRIVGGYDTNPAAWPWQAGIFWRRADGEVSEVCLLCT